MTRKDLMDALQASPPDVMTGKLTVVRPNTVWKLCLQQELDIMRLVARHTSIPIPNVHLSFPIEDLYPWNSTYMERISGTTLAELWPTMSWWRRLIIAATLRNYIRQFHNVPPHLPSSPYGIFWESPHTPAIFQNGFEMRDYFRRQILAHDMTPPVKDPGGWNNIVLCHMDLNPYNVMVDDAGEVWLIDFGFSGFYPAWMEAVNMHILSGSGRQGSSAPELRSYYALTFLICGWHWEPILWWEKYSFAWFPDQVPFLNAPDFK